ncbi:uncharacterized protein LOC111993329 [Quercus suber]|uniref:uncharacterized protein LOC111993329 n=1 Tax=Quercus suber TaxID=58331 RepID=UPI000CE19C63|nr:uncharacterized protein LOC111993329 [Quercus suber]
MDAFSRYNQIKIVEEDQEKIAFITSQGLNFHKVMPFGLKNAEATYQRFRISRTIISDNRWQFDSESFKDFCSSLELKNQFSSPRHPLANGQIEVTNRMLLKIIKSKLDDAKGVWPEELPNVLWAYRTMTRMPMGETPFRLTYGTKAVIPVETGATNIRREMFQEEGNND